VDFLTLENFLWAQAALVLFAIVYLLRKGKQPGARFRWGKKSSAARPMPAEMARREMWGGSARNSRPVTPMTAEERSLNVHFMHNGHSWDAYEAFGLPAGADFAKVEKAHREALAHTDPSSREFFDHALDAIRKHTKR
jgi:hypothetical protein